MSGKTICFEVTLINHNKPYVLVVGVDSSFPAGEILDCLSDIFDEEIHTTQIISLKRLADPLYGTQYFDRSMQIRQTEEHSNLPRTK